MDCVSERRQGPVFISIQMELDIASVYVCVCVVAVFLFSDNAVQLVPLTPLKIWSYSKCETSCLMHSVAIKVQRKVPPMRGENVLIMEILIKYEPVGFTDAECSILKGNVH